MMNIALKLLDKNFGACKGAVFGEQLLKNRVPSVQSVNNRFGFQGVFTNRSLPKSLAEFLTTRSNVSLLLSVLM